MYNCYENSNSMGNCGFDKMVDSNIITYFASKHQISGFGLGVIKL